MSLENALLGAYAAGCRLAFAACAVPAAPEGLRVLETNAITRLLLEDCIPYIQSHYRVRTDKWSRAMAGLSMGSMQTSMVTLGRPDLFGYAGVFSGFVGALKIGQSMPDQSYLKELDDKEKFQQDFKVFFRGCGDTDYIALDRFEKDRELFREKGLAPEDCPAHVEKIYHGEHEWNVWRMCLRDFCQLLFR